MSRKPEIVRTSEEVLDVLLEWVRTQRQKPWAESGSFASQMTGEEGYDEALEEFEYQIEALR